jgi:DNA primase
MPGIDYRQLQATISMRQVLALLDFQPISRRGHQLRGFCPLSACREPRPVFSVDTERGLFHCFACRAGGNQLDLWTQFHQLPLYQAAELLCHQTGTKIPRLRAKPP